MSRTLLKSFRRPQHQRDRARMCQVARQGGNLLDLELLALLQGSELEAVAHLQLTDLECPLQCAHLSVCPQEDAAP